MPSSNLPKQSSKESGTNSSSELSPELVKAVTEKVYKLIEKDLKIQNERRRSRSR